MGLRGMPGNLETKQACSAFQKGDRALPKHYRPIAIIPVSAKLYSMLILSRIKQQIDQALPMEQAGFRRGMGCADHIHTVRMVAEKSKAWGQTVWAASLDLEKAFDKVFFEAVTDGLTSSGVAQGTLRPLLICMQTYLCMSSSTVPRQVAMFRWRGASDKATRYHVYCSLMS